MKIIEQHDADLKEWPFGHNFTCKYRMDGLNGCGTVFQIENRSDFRDFVDYLPNGRLMNRYAANCPNCGGEVRLYKDV